MWFIRMVFWGAAILVIAVVGYFIWLDIDEKKRVKALSPEEQEEYYREIEEAVSRSLAKRDADKTSAMQCPLCQSNNVSVMGENKKSFSAKKAVAGTVLTGGVGAIAGFAGKKNGYDCYCGDCKHRFLLKDK